MKYRYDGMFSYCIAELSFLTCPTVPHPDGTVSNMFKMGMLPANIDVSCPFMGPSYYLAWKTERIPQF